MKRGSNSEKISKSKIKKLSEKIRKKWIKMRIEHLKKKEKQMGNIEGLDVKIEGLMKDLEEMGFNESENY